MYATQLKKEGYTVIPMWNHEQRNLIKGLLREYGA